MASRATSRTRTAEIHDSVAHLAGIFSSSEDGRGRTVPALDIFLRESIPKILEGQQVLAEGMRKLNQRIERLEKVERFVDFWDTPGRMVSQADLVEARDGLSTQIKENHEVIVDSLTDLAREPQRPNPKIKPSDDVFATPNPRRERTAHRSSMRTRTPGPTQHEYSDESVYSFHSRRTSPERVGRDPSTEPRPNRLRTATIKAESPEPTRDWRSTAAPEERKARDPSVRPLASSRRATTAAPT
uniref:CID domain-containing protein n=1 Tax=Globodera pallida TaxID=36090 RepID=A0A183CS54_GLOPA